MKKKEARGANIAGLVFKKLPLFGNYYHYLCNIETNKTLIYG